MSNANPLLQVKLTLQTQMVKDCLPLLLVLIDARVIRYDTGLSQLNTDPDRISRHKLYEVYINPPKGTTDNQRWAEETFMKATKMGFPALIVRPQQNAQEGTSLELHKQSTQCAVCGCSKNDLIHHRSILEARESAAGIDHEVSKACHEFEDNRNLDQVERNTQ